MSKLKNVRRQQAKRYMIREWKREVATREFVDGGYLMRCWFRFPPALVPRVMEPVTSGRRWKKATEKNRFLRKARNEDSSVSGGEPGAPEL